MTFRFQDLPSELVERAMSHVKNLKNLYIVRALLGIKANLWLERTVSIQHVRELVLSERR